MNLAVALSKAEFAAHRGVTPSCVSQWLGRGLISPPALRPDKKIDVAIADRQLEQRLRHGAARPRVDTDLLRTVIVQVEGLRARRALLDRDIGLCLKRAQAGGLDVPALRETLRRRGMPADRRADRDGLVAEYELALTEAAPAGPGKGAAPAEAPASKPSVTAALSNQPSAASTTYVVTSAANLSKLASSVRLFALPSKALPGARLDEVLERLGAPPGGGIFETAAVDLAREAIAAHRLGGVDPIGDSEIARLVYCRLAHDPIGGGLVGPILYFDDAAFNSPTLPPGGLAAADVVRAYMGGSPLPLAPPQTRIRVRLHRAAPSPLWRRREVMPRDAVAMLQQRERDRRIDAAALRRWLGEVRSAWWSRYALHRLIADLAEGAISAFDQSGDAVPGSFWESEMTLDLEQSGLLAPSDNRVPLRPALRFCAAGEVPVTERAAILARFGSFEAAITATFDEHRADLAGRSSRDVTAFLAERLPGINPHTIAFSIVARGRAEAKARAAAAA